LGDGVEYLKNLDYFEEIKDRVIFTGFINDSEKNKLLTLSRFYLQFSNYEGFGLAALEANLFKCFVFHSGSGGFLKTDDIWGKQILIDDNVNIFNLFKQIDFKLEEDLFDFRYNSLVEKYSRYERMLNIKNMIYEY
jgi:glycosyltransferase involved in cell wall biosynthesis